MTAPRCPVCWQERCGCTKCWCDPPNRDNSGACRTCRRLIADGQHSRDVARFCERRSTSMFPIAGHGVAHTSHPELIVAMALEARRVALEQLGIEPAA